jgi:AcrR family transcriptional regulator
MSRSGVSELARGSHGSESGVRTRGRPRQPGIEEAVLEATTALLNENGVGEITIDEIAQRSGCAKSTIYRRWATRDEIVVEALRRAVSARPSDVSAAHVADADARPLQAAGRRASILFDSPVVRAVLPILTREFMRESAIGAAFRREVFGPIRELGKRRLLEAAESGLMPAVRHPDLVLDLIYGGLLYRVLLGEPVGPEVADALADIVLRGAARGPGRGAG